MKTKTKAPASCGPTREIALLIADPSPALCAGTDRISAVVRGATSMHSPRPKMTPPGSRSVTYDSGGRKGEGACAASGQGGLGAGSRADPSAPTALHAEHHRH